jgi:hypothetical protein
MRPCGMADCTEWCDDAQVWCAKHTRTLAPTPKPTHAYDADSTQVRGIGVVTTRRILAHRPRSIRRSSPVSIFTDWSYSMQRDLDELERRIPRESRDANTRTVADVHAENRARTIALLKTAGTIRMGEQD